jgi:hypothetical protein
MSGELMKLDIPASDFGTLIVPGDRINVRATYSDNEFKLPTEEEYLLQTQSSGFGYGTSSTVGSVKRQELIFNESRVLDILNSSGESIFDIYYELIALPKRDQLARVETEEFKNSVTPQTFLLAVTAEEVDNYLRINGKGASYLLTMLPRTGSNVILESLNELQIGTGR